MWCRAVPERPFVTSLARGGLRGHSLPGGPSGRSINHCRGVRVHVFVHAAVSFLQLRRCRSVRHVLLLKMFLQGEAVLEGEDMRACGERISRTWFLVCGKRFCSKTALLDDGRVPSSVAVAVAAPATWCWWIWLRPPVRSV